MGAPKLVVVDDEQAFCGFIRKAAERAGYEVVIANSAEEFLNVIDADPPDVVVMDIIMPDMDGIELIKRLSDRHCTAAIIVISGYEDVYLEVAKKLAEAGKLNVVNTLAKPIRLQTFNAVLEQAMAGKSSAPA